jgi:hypothetical protein
MHEKNVLDVELLWYLEFHVTDDSMDAQNSHVVEEQNQL